jgi:hypothetical protein
MGATPSLSCERGTFNVTSEKSSVRSGGNVGVYSCWTSRVGGTPFLSGSVTRVYT